MAVAQIDTKQADELTNNIMMILDGIKPHTAIATITQVTKIVSLSLDMSFEDLMDDIITINDVMYDDGMIERIMGVQNEN